MKDKLISICKILHIKHVGIASIGPYWDLENILRERNQKNGGGPLNEVELRKKIDPRETMEEAQSVIVCLFPYFSGYGPKTNLAKYTHGRDYHLIIKEKLNIIGDLLKEQIAGFKYVAFTDTGPLIDRHLAYLAGLGFYGLNHHIINEKYGSYVLIGYIVNNYPFEADEPLHKKCDQCGACIEKCPGKALGTDYQMDTTKCLSSISQKKGELSENEALSLKNNRLVFGCDLCQDICPHNRKISSTPLKEFQEDLVHELEVKDVEGLSNKEFKAKYGERAFSWRGKQPILRNLKLCKGEDCSPEIEKMKQEE